MEPRPSRSAPQCTSRWLPAIAVPLTLVALATPPATAQDSVEGIPFHQYDPPATLVVPQHPLERARFPFIDVHSHQGQMGDQDLGPLVAEMDALNMAVMVNLSGRGFRRAANPDGTFRFGFQPGEYLKRSIENAERSAPGRFVVFTNVDTTGIDEPGWAERATAELATDVTNGAKGLKIYKSLGMDSKDGSGQRIPINDPRLDPIWRQCAQLGVPVLIHTADPAQFWQARDANNERLYELIERPERYRDPATNPPWEQLIAEQHDLFRRHPRTQFINAHLGWLGNDLGRLGKLLDELPNVTTEIGAVLAELGRQPRYAREWLIRYQDRVMFGKDAWAPPEYHTYFRVLETSDDYFDYYRRRHAFWKIYGLDLPDDVLKKIYYQNALRVIPGIDRSLFPD
ncbi:MAG TPA: amidohydrolase family protein [Thermoanaerobaculia bacterium]|nr:amidohydrolase family protein [Thermoanaerobaculia bacterium]